MRNGEMQNGEVLNDEARANYHPKIPLTSEATDAQIYERLLALPHLDGTNRVAQVAREFAAACVDADRALGGSIRFPPGTHRIQLVID